LTDEQAALMAAIALLTPHMDRDDLMVADASTAGYYIDRWARDLLHTLTDLGCAARARDRSR
jgi:hypothetical protein